MSFCCCPWSFRFLFYPYENLGLYDEKNREEFEVAFCELKQNYVMNCLQPVKHSSAVVCNIDYSGDFCLERLSIAQVVKMVNF